MTNFELVSVIIASGALIMACATVIFSALQTRKASQALLLQQQLIRGGVIESFTGRFSELLREGELHNKIKEEEWAYQFWSLLSTEFYFFHHGILPQFMFTLWMIDLSNLYTGKDNNYVKTSHESYLNKYSFLYEEMTSFFESIKKISKENNHELARNKEISEFTNKWIEENKKTIL